MKELRQKKWKEKKKRGQRCRKEETGCFIQFTDWNTLMSVPVIKELHLFGRRESELIGFNL